MLGLHSVSPRYDFVSVASYFESFSGLLYSHYSDISQPYLICGGKNPSHYKDLFFERKYQHYTILIH